MGKQPAVIAAAAGLSLPCYYDLEACDDDLNMTVSLEEIARLPSAVVYRLASNTSTGTGSRNAGQSPFFGWTTA